MLFWAAACDAFSLIKNLNVIFLEIESSAISGFYWLYLKVDDITYKRETSMRMTILLYSDLLTLVC